MNDFSLMLGLREGDVLIIAGDIGHDYDQDTAFLMCAKSFYKHVIIVPGNHDFYLINSSELKKYKNDSMNRIQRMKNFCDFNNIHYLDGQIIDINGFKFAGLGMSWDDSYYQILTGEKPSRENILKLFKSTMNDYRLIHNIDPFSYMEDQVNKLSKIESADVMVSHYSPVLPPNMREEFKRSPITTFYYFDGRKDVVRIDPKFWIFGHTHDSHDFIYNNTRLLCNPLGYPHENTYATVKSFEI